MNKLATTTFAALCGVAICHAEISSANIVGYTARDVANDFQIVPVQFENVDGTTIDLLKYLDFPTPTPVSFYGDQSLATQLWVQNVEGAYDTYYYVTDAFNMAAQSQSEFYVEGWCDTVGMLIETIPVAHGCSVWFYNPDKEAVHLSTAGQVLGDASKTVQYDGDFILTCCPFPVTVTFEDLGLTDGVTPVSFYGDQNQAVQIWVLNSDGNYDIYYYVTDAFNMAAQSQSEYYVEGWCDMVGMLVDKAKIFANPAQGFWVYSPVGQTIKLTYSK